MGADEGCQKQSSDRIYLWHVRFRKDFPCGGFPCQAFSHAAHGKNISEKNLWSEMYRFVQESDAPIVFGENVTLKAVSKAKKDLEQIGYKVELCRRHVWTAA